jgi:hypothetical protein
MQKLYLTHLNLEYDKNELKDEVGELDFKPFAPEQYYFRNTWLKARLREHIFMYPHIENLHKQLPGSIIVAYKQLANTSVHMHVDPATECSVNIVLSDDFAPVIFEDYGEINYECALFNTSLNHAVPAYDKERLLLKFSFLDTSYDKIREMLNDKIR